MQGDWKRMVGGETQQLFRSFQFRGGETMAVAGWVFSLAAVLSLLTLTATHSHREEIDTYHVSTGHLFVLKCTILNAHTNITWSRVGRHRESLPAGVEVRDGLLWFMPLQASHNGTYICEKRTKDGPSSMKLGVSVSSEECPDPTVTESIPQGVSGGLPCHLTEIFRLNNTRTIRWLKDCQLLKQQEKQDPPNENGFMRLPKVSESDAGKYTCLVEITVNGRRYTSASSIQLTIDKRTIYKEPHVLFPIQEVLRVDVGARLELKCEAYIGFSEDHNTLNMFWTVNGSFTDDYNELNESWDFVNKPKGRVHSLSTLSISKVLRQFLDVPIHCLVMSSVGISRGLVYLEEADHSAFYTSVAFCLTLFLTLLTLAAAFLFFRIELVLAYREMMTRLFKQPPDGKLYDAYVSFSNPDSLSSAERFALQVLPEKLEKQHGYSLYIRGRDDCPGEAMHDLTDATVRSCRRLIIILTANDNDANDDQHQLCYEQKIGLHDSLTQNEPQVILVEVDGPVDYTQLPESLRFIKRKQGALKWKTTSRGTHKFNSNRYFWKTLRYHMPSVPAGKRQHVV